MVGADRGEAHGELLDAIEALGRPPALTISQLVEKAPGLDWLLDLKMRRVVRKRLEDCSYIFVINPTAPDDGLWAMNKRRQAIYARSDLDVGQRVDAALALRMELNPNR